MITLIVLAFDNETGAEEMIPHVQTWQSQQLINIADAATVVWTIDGKIQVKQVNALVGIGTLGGTFWGLLIGHLFWASWSGLGVPNLAANQGSAYGLEDEFINEVRSSIKAGTSALLMMVPFMTESKVLPELAAHTLIPLCTMLRPENETKLCEAFGVVQTF